MYLTKQNAEQYVGKTLHCNGKVRFNYYPLRVQKKADGNYYYVDRNGTAIPVPNKAGTFDTVYFDYATECA